MGVARLGSKNVPAMLCGIMLMVQLLHWLKERLDDVQADGDIQMNKNPGSAS